MSEIVICIIGLRNIRFFAISIGNLKSLSKCDTIDVTFGNSYLGKSHSFSMFFYLCGYFSTG